MQPAPERPQQRPHRRPVEVAELCVCKVEEVAHGMAAQQRRSHGCRPRVHGAACGVAGCRLQVVGGGVRKGLGFRQGGLGLRRLRRCDGFGMREVDEGGKTAKIQGLGCMWETDQGSETVRIPGLGGMVGGGRRFQILKRGKRSPALSIRGAGIEKAGCRTRQGKGRPRVKLALGTFVSV
eukprot:359353-Chlamydomonas_euryale.AAC.1